MHVSLLLSSKELKSSFSNCTPDSGFVIFVFELTLGPGNLLLRLQSKEYKPKEKKDTQLSKELMATLNLRPEFIKLIEDPKNDFTLQFKKPQDLYELYLNLEEQNTTLIKRMQRLDEEIEIKREEFAIMKKGKETQIERLMQAKELLEKAIKDQKDAIQIILGPESINTKEYEEKWLKIIAKIVLLLFNIS